MNQLKKDFRLTDSAEEKIFYTIMEAFLKVDKLKYYPLLVWNNKNYDEKNTEIKSIPSFDLFLDDVFERKLGKSYYEVRGNKIYIFAVQRVVDECKEKILDYREGKLILLNEDEI